MSKTTPMYGIEAGGGVATGAEEVNSGGIDYDFQGGGFNFGNFDFGGILNGNSSNGGGQQSSGGFGGLDFGGFDFGGILNGTSNQQGSGQLQQPAPTPAPTAPAPTPEPVAAPEPAPVAAPEPAPTPAEPAAPAEEAEPAEKGNELSQLDRIERRQLLRDLGDRPEAPNRAKMDKTNYTGGAAWRNGKISRKKEFRKAQAQHTTDLADWKKKRQDINDQFGYVEKEEPETRMAGDKFTMAALTGKKPRKWTKHWNREGFEDHDEWAVESKRRRDKKISEGIASGKMSQHTIEGLSKVRTLAGDRDTARGIHNRLTQKEKLARAYGSPERLRAKGLDHLIQDYDHIVDYIE